MVKKNSRADRAKQFMPFAALKGYYDLVREKEKVVIPKKIKGDYENDVLNFKLAQLKKGMMITVKHYVKDGYINTDGIITEVDNTFKRLRIVRTYINYDDIDDITGEDIVEPDF